MAHKKAQKAHVIVSHVARRPIVLQHQLMKITNHVSNTSMGANVSMAKE
jgi:hypothetical protein